MGQDLPNKKEREIEEDFHVLVVALYCSTKILGKG